MKIRGRFAPTPSGFLHLGNVFCSLLAWLYAKSQGGEIVLRIEDLDSMRCPRSNADALAKDLEWLGLYWDEGAYCGSDSETYFQSNRFGIYEPYFYTLLTRRQIFPCFCSRNELHVADAPHLSDGRVIYPGTCRSLSYQQRAEKARLRKPAYRVRVPEETISFVDGHYGPQSFDLARENGDFIVRRSDGVYAYQLAVTIDDGLMGINQVVRGWDLLSSTPLQLLLYRLLDLPAPSFCHIPLLTAADGRRLAKRDGDTELAVLRQRFKGSPEPIIGHLAYLAGQIDKPEPLTAQNLLSLFDPQKLPLHNIIVPAELPLI